MILKNDLDRLEPILRAGGGVALLGMEPVASVKVLKCIAGAGNSTPDYSGFTQRLLLERNWRGHLIALAAVLLSREPDHALLWRTFDRGSWVAPQLAVALYWTDPKFAVEAKERIVRRCPITDDDGFFRGDTREASAKNLASLLQVMAYVPSESSWLDIQRRASDVKGLLAADIDSAGTIVEFWIDAALERFQECGHPVGVRYTP
jgi:hypothetical protein